MEKGIHRINYAPFFYPTLWNMNHFVWEKTIIQSTVYADKFYSIIDMVFDFKYVDILAV